MNNSGHGAMRAFSQIMQCYRPPGIDLPGLAFVYPAKGLGCLGERFAQVEHLDRILGDALAANGSAPVDVVVDDATTDPFSPWASKPIFHERSRQRWFCNKTPTTSRQPT
jgi:benzoylformate decarboxylase